MKIFFKLIPKEEHEDKDSIYKQIALFELEFKKDLGDFADETKRGLIYFEKKHRDDKHGEYRARFAFGDVASSSPVLLHTIEESIIHEFKKQEKQLIEKDENARKAFNGPREI
jgi:hypothetical protein